MITLSYLLTILCGLASASIEFLTIESNSPDSAKNINVYNHYRLPRTVIPKRYVIQVTTNLEPKSADAFHFNGNVQIHADIVDNTNEIVLHVANLTIDEPGIMLNALQYKEQSNCIKETAVNSMYDYYILKTCYPLSKGDKYKITIPFKGVLNEKLRGYYKSKFVDKASKEERYLSITQFEPTSARTAFPCFDEPVFKAKFTVILGHDKKFTALSNMPVKNVKEFGEHDNYIWTEFEESVPMSTYLVAYSINDFDHISHSMENSHVTFRTWARPDAIDQCKYAGNVGPKILSYYEEIFGIEYPLPKMDQMAVPDFSAGAMENWGLVTYRETALLYAENISSIANKQRVASVIAHELAHQWFGNLVTMKWWSDLWLNEGFATYVASLGVEHVHPEWKLLDEESVRNQLTIFSVDALKSSRPLSQPITNLNKINEFFDSISYKKGSVALRMIHLFMSDDAFKDGIKNYLQKHTYGNAEQDYLWESLTESAHKFRTLPQHIEIKRVMDTWSLQTGYPIIKVTRDYEDNLAYITQERFLTDTNVSRKDFKNCWFVPLTYTTKSEMDFTSTPPRNWLKCDDSGNSIPLTINNLPNGNEWIIFNIQMSGLYKIKYDDKNFKMIIDTMMSDEYTNIHPINRAHLIDDALTLAWSGDQTYDLSLSLLEYLIQEREYLPWMSALENLGNIYRVIRHTPQMEYFKKFMKSILNPIYMALSGINPPDEFMIENPSERLHRVLIASWACRFEIQDCVPRSKQYFREWRQVTDPDLENNIPTDFRPVVYCTAIRHGNDDDWQFLWDRYKSSNVAAEKKTIISALGCSREVWILQRYLEQAFTENSDIRQQDATSVFSAVGRNDIGLHLAKDYFFANIKKLHQFYEIESSALGTLLSILSTEMSTEQAYEHINNFVTQHKELFKKAEKAVNRSLETVQINTSWRKANFVELSDKLRVYSEAINTRLSSSS